jgi:hypothetical protein
MPVTVTVSLLALTTSTAHGIDTMCCSADQGAKESRDSEAVAGVLVTTTLPMQMCF